MKKKAKSKKHPSIYNKNNKLSRNTPVNHFNQNKTYYVHIIYWSPNSISRHTIYNPQWEIAKFDQNHNDLQQYQKTFNCIIVLQFVEKIKFFEHDKLIIANTTWSTTSLIRTRAYTWATKFDHPYFHGYSLLFLKRHINVSQIKYPSESNPRIPQQTLGLWKP